MGKGKVSKYRGRKRNRSVNKILDDKLDKGFARMRRSDKGYAVIKSAQAQLRERYPELFIDLRKSKGLASRLV